MQTNPVSWNQGSRTASGVRLVLAAMAALAVTTAVRRADACSTVCPSVLSPPRADNNRIQFPPDGVMFVADPRATTASLAEYKVTIREFDSGVIIPASLKTVASGDLVLAPDQPLPPNQRFRLSYDGFRCGPSFGPFDPTRPPYLTELVFYTSSSKLTDLEYTGLRLESEGLVSHDPDGQSQRRPFVTLALDGAGASSPLAEYTVTVDGAFFQHLSLGSRPLVTIEAICDRPPAQNSCGTYDGVTPGRHLVAITPRVIGASVQRPGLAREVNLVCEPAPPVGCSLAPTGRAPWSVLALLAFALAAAFGFSRRRGTHS